MNNVKTNVVEIDGTLFKTLLESAAGKSLKEISLENGFSDSFLRMVVKTGKASPSAQAIGRLYGIEPSAYEKKADIKITCEPKTDAKQLSIDDLTTEDTKEILKGLIMDCLTSVINHIDIRAYRDPTTLETRLYVRCKEEA